MKLPNIAPLQLVRRREPFDHPEWMFELKHDGFRGLAYVADGKCKLVSRHGNVFKSFKPLHVAFRGLPAQDAILDGEIICVDEEGVSVFNQLMFRRGMPYFYAFDLLWMNGKDLRGTGLLERKERLRKLVVRTNHPALLYADYVDQYGTEFFGMICDKNLEGILAKHRSEPYNNSTKWIKIKNPSYTQTQGRHELFEGRTKVRVAESRSTGLREKQNVR